MRQSPWYILLLLAVIGGALAYVHLASRVINITVTATSVEAAQGRRGTFDLYVIQTNQGSFPILKFPLVGYMGDIEELHQAIKPGDKLDLRIGTWPPPIIGEGRDYIFDISK
jgi:hypothetical protein